MRTLCGGGVGFVGTDGLGQQGGYVSVVFSVAEDAGVGWVVRFA